MPEKTICYEEMRDVTLLRRLIDKLEDTGHLTNWEVHELLYPDYDELKEYYDDQNYSR